jgi:predicted ABC-class ATPase
VTTGTTVPASELRSHLVSLDGKGYRAYKAIGESYAFPGFTLRVDHVQGDPFADPSRLRAVVPTEVAGIPADLLETEARRTAAADFLNRAFARALAATEGDRGSGRSGELRILRPGQQVLRRTSLVVHPDGVVEARFRAGLPARGRRILGREAAELLCDDVPQSVEAGLRVEATGEKPLRRHVEAYEDAEALRGQLAARELVAFVADGSLLPRRSGVDDRPLARERAVPFESPGSLRVTLEAPHAGRVMGMGVPEGVTLLVGGGFHGKSTLLRALERGVYNHIPGDGRQRVVTLGDAVKVRAEDGRQVTGTDISNFIGDLPGGEDTRSFHTENASGSTSQAAAIAESLEVGTRCLLLDEDTSATNFLIRDARVQALIAKEHEPITPFIDRARALHREHGVSVVLVIGGAGDYFDVADTVIALRGYHPFEVTEEAREIARRLPSERRPEGVPWSAPATRVPDAGSVSARRGRREVHIKVFGEDRMAFGEEELDLSAIEQLVERGQVAAIGRALVRAASGEMGEGKPLPGVVRKVVDEVMRQGLDLLDERIVGDYAEFRAHEMAAVLNRLRTLRTHPA